jgi:phenylalanyl-tRNA synthetase beta chain
LAGVTSGRADAESWASGKREVDFFDVKGDVESVLSLAGHRANVAFRPAQLAWLHPGRSAEILVGTTPVGIVGCLHPRLLKALDLDHDVHVFEADLGAIRTGSLPRAGQISHFPSLRRDLAVVVPVDVAYEALQACVRGALGPQLAEVVVFDQYQGTNLGPGVKSVAIGLILQDDSRTLTDEDADRCMAQALAALERECRARLRG